MEEQTEELKLEEQTEEPKTQEQTEKSKIEKLSEELKEMALTLGAFKVGIATTETLAGGPPSADLTYVLPGAKSAVVCPGFDNLIDPYFKRTIKRSTLIKCGSPPLPTG